MAGIRETYELNTAPAVAGLDKATQAAERHQAAINKVAEAYFRGEATYEQVAAAYQRQAEAQNVASQATAQSVSWLDRLGQAANRARQGIAAKTFALIDWTKQLIYTKTETGEYEGRLRGVTGAFHKFGSAASSAHNPLDGITHRMARMAMYFFSVRRLIRYVINAIQRAPADVAAPFNQLKTNITDGFTRPIVAMMDGMSGGVKRLNAALASDAGQKFMRGMEALGRAAGVAVGFLFEKIAQLVEFVGNNFETVMSVALPILGAFAAKMLLSAAASALAHWKLLLVIAVVAGLVKGLQTLGFTAEDIFGGIARIAGWVYTFLHNRVADLYNVFATLAEFLANVFNDPVGSIARLFADLVDWVLDKLQFLAGGIDFLFGTGIASSIAGLRASMRQGLDDMFGKPQITYERMAYLDYGETGDQWSAAGRNFGRSLSDFSLAGAIAQPIKSIDENVSSIKKAVNMAEEDIKALVDVAERRFVNMVNLTSQAPVINVQGQNTGRTEEDRRALADTLAAMLLEQFDAGSSVTTAMTF